MEPQPQEIIDRIAAEVPSIKDLLNCRLACRQFLASRELTARLAQSPEFGVAYGSPKYSKLLELLNEKSTINSLINSLTVWASSKCNESEEDGINTLFSKVLPKLQRLRKLSLHNVGWSRLQNAGREALLELYHLEELELFNCTFPDINVLLAMISIQTPGTLFLDIDSISLECPGTAVDEGRSLTTVRELVLGRSVADHDLITRFSELKPQLEQLSLYYASEESVCWIQPLLYSSGERLKEVMIEGLWPGNPENPIVLSFDQNRALTCLELRFYDSGPAGYIEIPHDVVATLAKVNTCLKEITLCFALEEEEDRVIDQIAPRNFDMFEHVLIEKFGRSQMPTVSVCVNYMEGDLMEEFQRMMYKDTPELHSLGKITVSETGWI